MEEKAKTKRLAIIGLGNAGGNIVKLFGEKYRALADLIIINTSTTDMSKFPSNTHDYSIRMGSLDGTGGQHDVAKQLAINSIESKVVNDKKLNELLDGKEYIFIVGSSAGGTGSGMLPVMYQVVSKVMQYGEKVIGVCILPEEGLTADRLDNTLLNQSELYMDPEATYMIYDNSRFDIKSSFELKAKINEEIVEDIAVFSGKDLLKSDYNNIDGEDLLALASLPGRIVVVRCEKSRKINHNDIESRILSDLDNRSAHAILNEDRVVGAYGVIANLAKDSIEGFDESLPKIRQKIGEPVSTYLNLSCEEDVANQVVFIMSGLAKPNARLFEIHELLEAKKAKIKNDDSVFNYRDESLTNRRRQRPLKSKEDKERKETTLDQIFKSLK